jgi:hypothetical protein
MQFYTNSTYAEVIIFLPGSLYLQHLLPAHLAYAVPATHAARPYCLHSGHIGHRAFRDTQCDR